MCLMFSWHTRSQAVYPEMKLDQNTSLEQQFVTFTKISFFPYLFKLPSCRDHCEKKKGKNQAPSSPRVAVAVWRNSPLPAKNNQSESRKRKVLALSIIHLHKLLIAEKQLSIPEELFFPPSTMNMLTSLSIRVSLCCGEPAVVWQRAMGRM